MTSGPSSPSPSLMASTAPLSSPNKVADRLSELDSSQSELLIKIQGLKQEVQSWRLEVDSQVNNYKEELSNLKKALNSELDQLKSEFKELRTTIEKQEENDSISSKTYVNIGSKSSNFR